MAIVQLFSTDKLPYCSIVFNIYIVVFKLPLMPESLNRVNRALSHSLSQMVGLSFSVGNSRSLEGSLSNTESIYPPNLNLLNYDRDKCLYIHIQSSPSCFFVCVNFGTAPPPLPPSIVIDKVRAPAIRIVVEDVVFLLSQIEDGHVLI